MRVLAVAPGPDGHGVVRHAQDVGRLLRDAGVDVCLQRAPRPAPAGVDLTWVQFTEAVFGPDPAAAAAAFTTWAATAPRPLVVTLHDVPGLDADPVRDAARRAGYRRVAAAADAVVVSARREVDDVRRLDGREPALVPLPVVPLVGPGPAPAWSDRPSIGVLGFVYPGKGHDRALAAAARLGADRPRVVAAGGAGEGSAGLLDDLHRTADRLGVELLVTGPLSDADLHAAARAVTVPLAAYRTPGASGSLATWVAAGRRPVTSPSPSAEDLEARDPGALLLTGADGVDAAVARALADPTATWRRIPVVRPDVVGGHLRAFRAALSEAALSTPVAG